MYNILISGYYGFDNIGDESILRTLITSLREKIPDCRLTVLSHNPASTREKYGVEAVERMSPGAILRAVRQCDMLISGGGSLLQDVTSSKSIHYYLFIIRLAKLLGKKVFIYSQGIGPIDHAFNRRATARALKKADGIVVRDERSAKLLEQIGLPQERIVITADPVIRMKRPDRTVGREILARAGIKKDGRLTVGWAIREKNRDSTFVREITECIRWLRENYDAESVLIPFHYEEDREVCSVIAERTNGAAKCLSEKYLSEDMLSIIGNMDVLVGVRLHSMIYAAIMGVPIIGVSYDPKCTAFLNSVGLDSLSTRETFSAAAFKAEFARVLETGKEQTATVAENMRRLQKKLDTNEEMIRDIMEGQKKGKAAGGEAASTRTAGAIGLVFILTLVAKLLGVVREMLQANYFGTGIDADLYTASYNSTLYLFTTVCYALCIAAVPILTQEFAAKRERGIRAANNLVTITLLGSLGVVGVWQVLASTPLVGILWDVAESELPRLVGYIRIMSCALPIVAMAYLMVALFQATDHYELQGSMSIPYNVFLAVFLFLFGSKLGIGGIVVASAFAWLLQLGMSLPYAHKENYRYRPALDLRADYIGRYFKTAAVSVLTTSVFLFCYLIDTSTASAFDSGAVSSFYYADKLFTPLTTTVLYSISAVMFPRFNREFTKDDTGSYLSYIWNVTENTLLFIFPVCAMMSAFGTDIIRVIFESGSFTAESTEVTGNIFGMYALGMSAFAVLDLLNKAYYAMKKTLVPLLINLGILVLNLILNSLFDTGSGVALATSAAITVGALVMIAELFRGRKIVRIVPLAKGLASAGAMAVVLYGGHALLVNGLESKLMLVIKCGALGAAGCVVYVLVSLALKQAIISEFLHKLRKRA
ncbi:MAG: polysaccharide pyruvyl transferase CsaB [Oscillospiraceae bacterium]|nr:polysaccharide pyruvyl transferase CsaB [Oscillospiraceae bacterium]MDY5735333.1 polysaccharide pyruvyl transferase CsaB [Oscillospiraceae bacterium]